MTLIVMICVSQQIFAQGAIGPFEHTESVDLGRATGVPSYDLQPTVLYDPDDPARLFKMWWLGSCEVEPGCGCVGGIQDIEPCDHLAGDRIYFSSSTDGAAWTDPVIVLKPQGGLAGYDAADDHLIGSPSVLKIDGIYYMFYEAYGTWVTNVARLWNPDLTDTWSWSGAPQFASAWKPDDTFETTLGFAPAFRKPGTRPIYAGEVTHWNGLTDRFLSCAPVVDFNDGRVWTPLNGNLPIFWLYEDDAPGRQPLYSCWDGGFWNVFNSNDPCCEGRLPDGLLGCDGGPLLGYSIASTASPDMEHANQNRICLATSSDGVTWQRFIGGAPGGAVIVPQEAFTNMWPHPCGTAIPLEQFDVHRAYGAGFPVALVREEMLELWFTDDSLIPLVPCDGPRPPVAWRVRIPIGSIGDPFAYIAAEKQDMQREIPGDLAWSPMHLRYFSVALWHEDFQECIQASPRLIWSGFNPPAAQPHQIVNGFTSFIPTGSVVASLGALARDGNGHTLDFPDAMPTPYTAFHIYYQGNPPPTACDIFTQDIYHSLTFGYPLDADDDRVPDWFDMCDGFDDAQDCDNDGIPDGCDCLGDISGNASVDLEDLNIVLSSFGELVTSGTGGDADCSGTVDINDLNHVLAAWGTTCPPALP